jgi:hypothetical protein
MADRKKKAYLPNIVPDVITPGATGKDSDPAIDAVKKWVEAR